MKAFVTGSTGLLGSNLIPLLVENGFTVKALVRSPNKTQEMAGDPKVEIISGDMLDVDGFAPHLAGCDVLFHLAAYYREYMETRAGTDLLDQINVTGTMKLFEVARRQGLRNVIHVSSGGVVDFSGGNRPVDETAPYDEGTDNLYFKAKIRAEKEIDRYLARHDDMRIVVVRPSLMMGPGDAAPTPAGQFILNFLDRKIPVVLPGSMVIADVRDVARAMLAAVKKGQSSDRFFLGGQAHKLTDLMGALEQVSGVPCPKKHPPYALAYLMLSIGNLLGKKTPVKPRDLKRMQTMQAPDSTKAEEVLGYQITPIEETIGDAVAWFRAHRSK